jgi:hypothetical protein
MAEKGAKQKPGRQDPEFVGDTANGRNPGRRDPLVDPVK